MEKIKDKYEVILGFVTLVISFSAFKEELTLIKVDLGYLSFQLSRYFIWIVFGFSICVYLYITEKITRDTKIGKWKIFDYVIKIAYFLFAIILLTPVFIILSIIIYKLSNLITDNYHSLRENIMIYLNIITSLSGIILASITSKIFLKEKRQNIIEEIEEQKIKDLENATKLYVNEFYSHSLLESYKVLELFLYKKLVDKNIRVSKHNMIDMMNIALKENIINNNDMIIINDIRKMRNLTAHSNFQHTKKDAEYALLYIKELMSRETS